VKRLVLTALACGALVLPAAIFAAPSDNGDCRQAVHDLLVTSSAEGTMGDAISDGFYGNEPNPEPPNPGGGTLPSQSPGPKVTNPDGTVSPGNSWGFYESGAIKDACNG